MTDDSARKIMREMGIVVIIFAFGFMIVAVKGYLENRQRRLLGELSILEESSPHYAKIILEKDVLAENKTAQIMRIEKRQKNLWRNALFVFLLGYPLFLIGRYVYRLTRPNASRLPRHDRYR